MRTLAKGASWLGGISGAGLPALSYFKDYAPPLFAGASVIITALAAAILLVATPRKAQPGSNKLVITYLSLALALLIAYALFLTFTTVVGPDNNGARYQIGFGRAQFSLTDVARGYLRDDPTLQPKDLMLYEKAFDQGRIPILWQTWSVYAAGLILIVVYFFGFIFWTIGFALLAKR
jgi:hypothetical protein